MMLLHYLSNQYHNTRRRPALTLHQHDATQLPLERHSEHDNTRLRPEPNNTRLRPEPKNTRLRPEPNNTRLRPEPNNTRLRPGPNP
jgi:hypothetical protein